MCSSTAQQQIISFTSSIYSSNIADQIIKNKIHGYYLWLIHHNCLHLKLGILCWIAFNMVELCCVHQTITPILTPPKMTLTDRKAILHSKSLKISHIEVLCRCRQWSLSFCITAGFQNTLTTILLNEYTCSRKNTISKRSCHQREFAHRHWHCVLSFITHLNYVLLPLTNAYCWNMFCSKGCSKGLISKVDWRNGTLKKKKRRQPG